MDNTLHTVLAQYGLPAGAITIQPFGSGLINHTWLVNSGGNRYILQRVNHRVFSNPAHIAHNTRLLAGYLATHHPGYLFTAPVLTVAGEELVHLPAEGWFRLFPFVPGSHTVNVAASPEQAYEAARQFGCFTGRLAGFPSSALHITVPDFHNLPLRYQQFLAALRHGNPTRISGAAPLTNFLQQQQQVVTTGQALLADPGFKKRVTHHDTKISNVLFDDNGKGLCVIDLDTVMPGYFISDVGDMMRTYLSPVDEEEADHSRIEIRDEYLAAIQQGYLDEMAGELTAVEKRHFTYAGIYMIYMQALRFLTDHLNNDSYYGARYEGHNFIRAGNQVVLLQRLLEKHPHQ